MKKIVSILLTVVLFLSVTPVSTYMDIISNAAAPATLYLTPTSTWANSGAWFAAYFFGNGEKWVKMTDSDGDGTYEVSVPSGYPSVIFCRMNGGTSDNNWDNKWNQSNDLDIVAGKTYVVPTDAWDKWTA